MLIMYLLFTIALICECSFIQFHPLAVVVIVVDWGHDVAFVVVVFFIFSLICCYLCFVVAVFVVSIDVFFSSGAQLCYGFSGFSPRKVAIKNLKQPKSVRTIVRLNG